jgi:hypothetical protein
LTTIFRCTNRPDLDRLGEILRAERDWYDENAHVSSGANLGATAWAKQAQLLREEDERLQPFRAHQQGGEGVVFGLGTNIALLS